MMDIRTFSSPDEIRELPNFVENNPLTKVTYKGLAGDYHFGEDVECCFQKENGNLCLHSHRRGWLIELLDGTVTLLGKNCASAQFSLESKLIGDRKLYNNEKRRKQSLAALKELVAQKPIRLEQLGQMRSQLESLKSRTNALISDFGENTRRQLITLGRSGKPDVLVKGVKLRPYVDDNGKQKQERSVIQVKLGSFNGLALIQPESFYQLFQSMRDVSTAYDEAETIEDSSKASEVDRLVNKLGDVERILREGEQLLALESSFTNNNFELLYYVVQDHRELEAIMVKLMNDAGQVGGRKKSRGWFADKHQQLLEQLGVDKIERI